MNFFTKFFLFVFFYTITDVEAQTLESNFTFTTSGSVVTFENTSISATTFHWDFGDGTSSSALHPIHNYTNPDSTYQIILVASNSSDSDTTTAYLSFTCMSYVLDLDYLQDSILCADETDILVAPIGFYTYQWYRDGDPLHMTYDNFTEIESAGEYMCIMTTAAGCGAISNLIYFYSAPDSTAQVISSDFDLDIGSEVILALDYSPASILWSTGDTSHEISISQSGVYSAEFTNTYGCHEIKTKSIQLDTSSLPELILFENRLAIENLTLAEVENILWFKDEILLDSLTQTDLEVNASGNYKALVLFQNGNDFGMQKVVELNLSSTSAIVPVLNEDYIVYLNKKSIKVPDSEGSYAIYDWSGKLLAQDFYQANNAISSNAQPPYLVQIQGANGLKVTRKIF